MKRQKKKGERNAPIKERQKRAGSSPRLKSFKREYTKSWMIRKGGGKGRKPPRAKKNGEGGRRMKSNFDKPLHQGKRAN